jgi:hypothetical protein
MSVSVPARWKFAFLTIASALCAASASAALHLRLPASPGGIDYVAVYDDVQDITWMRDANLAMLPGAADTDGVASTLTWDDAVAWAASLNFAGFDDWRLPTNVEPDPSCQNQAQYGSSGLGCVGGELGHLVNAQGIDANSPGPFLNIQPFSYWYGTQNSAVPGEAFYVVLSSDGFTGSVPPPNELHAWAVRDGDVIGVSEPPALLLGLLAASFAATTFVARGRAVARRRTAAS